MSRETESFRPPRLARALLDRIVPPERAAETRADLLEVCSVEARLHGERVGRRRYWREVLGLLRWRSHLGRRVEARSRHPGRDLLAGLAQDARHAARSLGRRPRTALLSIGLLAVGIGVSTAMFSLLEAVVLRPLRLPDSERVVRVQYGGSGAARFDAYLSGPDFERLRSELARGADRSAPAAPFDDLVAVGGWLPTLVVESGARRLWAGRASPWIFRTLGVAPMLGRDFAAADPSGDGVILGYAPWRSAFGGAPDIVGRRVEIPPRTYTVIGVLPPEVDLPGGHELWVPLDLDAASWMRDPAVRPFRVYGRVARDVPMPLARARTATLGDRIADERPETNEGLALDIVALRDTIADPVARPLAMLLGAVLTVLLVACANVAHLLLAAGVARSREFATHLALGSTRGRLVRKVLMEAWLVAVAGAAAGVAAAAVMLGAIRGIAPAGVPRLEGLAINATVLGFATVTACLAALVAGVAPALRAASGAAPADRVPGGRASGRDRPGRLLLMAEVALSALLLVGAGLFLRSLGHLDTVSLGLEPVGFQVFRAGVASGRDGVATTDAIRGALESLGNIESIVATSHAPLSGGYLNVAVELRDAPVRDVERPQVAVRMVSPGYLEALGVPLRRGRTLGDADRSDDRHVAVVNESAARALWLGKDPIGQQLALADRPQQDGLWIEVVGLVGDVRQSGPGAPPMPAVYVPYAQAGPGWSWIGGTMAFLLRPAGGTPISEQRLRDAVRDVGADIAVFGVTTLAAYLGESTAQTRFTARLLQAFSAVAFLLAAAGIYGVVSFGVRRRTRDIAIRLALGADAVRVRREVVGEALRLALAGAAVGLALALVAGRWIAGQLHGVTPLDPPTHVATALALLVASTLAAWLPARAAARLDPAETLRAD